MPLLSAIALAAPASCDTTDTACSASHLLHWLYIAAGVLAVVLAIVVLLAVQVWRKNKDRDPNE